MEIQKKADRSLISLLAAVILAGVSWAAMMPLWQAPDEQAHFAQAQDYAAVGYRPNPGASTSQDILISEKLLGTFRDELGNNKFTYHPEYRLPYSNSTQGFNEEEIVKLPLQMRKVFLINEATGYPPLYYWYIALINKIMWGQDLITRVFASRLGTVLISAAGVLAAYSLARQIFVRRSVALAVAGMWGLMPMRQFVGSGVTGDALMNSVYPLALLCLVKLATAPSRKIFWLTMITVGAAMAVKLQSVFLIPGLIAALIIAGRTRMGLGKLEKTASKLIILIIGLTFLVTVLGHIRPLANKFPQIFGYLFLPEIANFSDLYSRPTVAEYVRVTAVELYRQGFPWYFGVYRWLSLTLPIWVYRVIKIVILMSLGGWVLGTIKWLGEKKKRRWMIENRSWMMILVSSVVYALGLLVWNFFYWKSHGFSLGIQGRYFFPNMAEHMILLIGGLVLLTQGESSRATGGSVAISGIAASSRRDVRTPRNDVGTRLIIFLSVLGMVIFNWYSLWFVSSSYFDNVNLNTFFLQASQYKPWFFKWPFLPGVIGLGLVSSGWFLWEFGVECFRGKINDQ